MQNRCRGFAERGRSVGAELGGLAEAAFAHRVEEEAAVAAEERVRELEALRVEQEEALEALVGEC